MKESGDLYTILACSMSGERLRLLEGKELKSLNERLESGELIGRNGDTPTGPFEAALATGDDAVFYPVIEGIPMLLPEDGLVAS